METLHSVLEQQWKHDRAVVVQMSWKASAKLTTGDASDWQKVIFELLAN